MTTRFLAAAAAFALALVLGGGTADAASRQGAQPGPVGAGGPMKHRPPGSGAVVKVRVFPNGRELLPAEVVKRGTLIDPAAATLPGKAPGVTFEFLFWDVDGRLNLDRTIKVEAAGGVRTFATAWYLRTGGGDGTCAPNCAVGTWAFSLKNDKIMKGVTPIGSVSPSSLWSSPSTSVSTMSPSGSVAITAQTSFSQPPYPAMNFVRWLELPNQAVAGPTLTVPAKSDALAIGFFSPAIQRPPPPGCKSPKCI